MTLGVFLQDPDFIRLLYIVAFVLFIVGMRFVTSPPPRAGATWWLRSGWRSRWSPRF